jgi:hypothetical protein
MTVDVDVVDGESTTLDFKSSFDPDSKQDWCELIKDMLAMSNSGGGQSSSESMMMETYRIQTLRPCSQLIRPM